MLNYTIDGKEVTVSQDYDGCTMEFEAWEEDLEMYGIAIETYDRNPRSFGDLDLLKDIEDREEDYNRLMSDVELYIEQLQAEGEGGLNLGELAICANNLKRATAELAKHIKNRRFVYAFEYCPYADLIHYFKVTVDYDKWQEAAKKYGLSVEMVQSVVSDFDTVYRGGVWVVEIEGQEPIHGVVFSDELPADDELRELFE